MQYESYVNEMINSFFGGEIVLFGHDHLVGNMVFTPWICAYRIFRQTHITSHDEFSLYKIILNHMPSGNLT